MRGAYAKLNTAMVASQTRHPWLYDLCSPSFWLKFGRALTIRSFCSRFSAILHLPDDDLEFKRCSSKVDACGVVRRIASIERQSARHRHAQSVRGPES